MNDTGNKTIASLAVLAAILFIISFAARSATKHVKPTELEARAGSSLYVKKEAGIAPEISASAVTITRLRTGEVLFSQNSETLYPIASITKLLTAALFLEHIDLFEGIEISSEAKKVQEAGEKIGQIPAGEIVKGEDILKLMIINSESDAARAAADAVIKKLEEESVPADFWVRMEHFAVLMNELSEKLGMAQSHFDNPVGLDSINNYSTVGDIVKLLGYITEKHPRIWDVSRIYETDIFTRSGIKYHLTNTDTLLTEFSNIVGSKTGTTDEAKESLVLVVNIMSGDPLAFVILRSDDRLKDARTLIAWVKLVYGL